MERGAREKREEGNRERKTKEVTTAKISRVIGKRSSCGREAHELEEVRVEKEVRRTSMNFDMYKSYLWY